MWSFVDYFVTIVNFKKELWCFWRLFRGRMDCDCKRNRCYLFVFNEKLTVLLVITNLQWTVHQLNFVVKFLKRNSRHVFFLLLNKYENVVALCFVNIIQMYYESICAYRFYKIKLIIMCIYCHECWTF